MGWCSNSKSFILNKRFGKTKVICFLIVVFLFLNINFANLPFLAPNSFYEQKIKNTNSNLYEMNRDLTKEKIDSIEDLNPTSNIIRTLAQHTDRIISLAFSPDGRILASGSEDDTECHW